MRMKFKSPQPAGLPSPFAKRPRSLRRNLLSLLGSSLLVVIVLTVVAVNYLVHQTEEDAWQDRQREAAQRAAELVGAFLHETEYYLRLASVMEHESLEVSSQAFGRLLGLNSAMLEIVRVDAEGVVTASAYQGIPLLADGEAILESTWFLQAVQGRLYLSDGQESPTGESYIIMAIPSPDGGVAAARMRVDVFRDVVDGIRFGKTGTAYVINLEGTIVGHKDAQVLQANTHLAGRPELAAILAAPNYEWNGRYENFEGKQVAAATDRISGTDWLIVTEISQAEATAVSRAAWQVLGSALLLITALVTVASARLLRRLVIQPMEVLRTGVERIGQGDLSHRIGAVRDDEVGLVARAFNEMTERLQVRDKELALKNASLITQIAEKERVQESLSQARDELEMRVSERTVELAIMLDTANTVSSSLELEQVVETIAEKMIAAIGVSGCTVSRYDQGADAVVTWIERRNPGAGSPEEPGTAYLLAEYPTTKSVIMDRKPATVRISDLYADPAEVALLYEIKSASLMMLPLVVGDHTIGLVELDDVERERVFTDAEIQLCRALADQAAIAISNARLYTQAQQEIVERIRAEEQIQASLEEKEVLLKEIHHRVKNNLQVIASMLNLQSGFIADPKALEIFQDSQNRVEAMAVIHEKLYKSENLARIDLADYVRDLTAYLISTYESSGQGVRLRVEADDVWLGVSTAVPCGLILNELVSNALKHAFPGGSGGQIQVNLRNVSGSKLTLSVADDGVGLPPRLDFRNTTSLGLQLVNTLVNQLAGTLEHVNTHGTTFQITFSAPSAGANQ